ncbi:MAG: helix-turn-helix transcriptional regulator [Clostridia bacterium]|nr:helix-turn-helix transcriptional regulator [Clostridia bacterium]MBR6687594.1 helix-turn-helix transcriptional regulator [Clostridia bacterium]
MEENIVKTRVAEEIKNSGLSTIEIAKRIGVTPEMVTQYKTTKKLSRLDTFAKLCKELDLDANYILGIKND